MKHILLVVFYAFSIVSFGQNLADKKQSNIGAFLNSGGNIIHKKFEDVGRIEKVEIQKLTVTDMMKKDTLNGIELSFNTTDGNSTVEVSTFFDDDEVKNIITTLKVIKNEKLSTSSNNYEEIFYQSRSGATIGVYFLEEKWTFFVQLIKNDNDSVYQFKKISRLDDLLTILDEMI